MATVTVIGNFGSPVGTPLQELLGADEIQPGAQPSYELCKLIYEYHVLGKKMADAPVEMAIFKPRQLAVDDDESEEVTKAFQDEWDRLKLDDVVVNIGGSARRYGISSLGILVDDSDYPSEKPLPFEKLADLPISINVWDPLNTAGSLVLNQDPNAVDFQKHSGLSVNGRFWNRNRTCVLMNERPVYISYTSSAFGFVGRSVYQRGLFPLKSYISSMQTDELVVLKAGVLIAKLKQAGSIINNAMQALFGQKRDVIKEARVGNVISTGPDDAIETLNMQNLDGAYGQARTNILENVAASDDMPAIILRAETFAEGFGEGTQDAAYVAKYLIRIQKWLQPIYDFFDPVVQYRAWNRRFFEMMKQRYPDSYDGVTYEEAFMRWCNSFTGVWPSQLLEPESDAAEQEDVAYKSAIAIAEVLMPVADQPNKAAIAGWLASLVNSSKAMFKGHQLNLDLESFALGAKPDGEDEDEEPKEPQPFSSRA